MKSITRKILIVVGVLLSLLISWWIGQWLHRSDGTNTTSTSAETVETRVIVDNSEVNEAQSLDRDSVTFEKAHKVTDNPWETTAGIIEVEDEGECVFLTPNTLASINLRGDISNRIIKYEIHPWMWKISDGAGLKICLLDDNDVTQYESNVDVKPNNKWTELEIKVSEYPETRRIVIHCDNGMYDNDDGDWVLIKVESK